MIHPYLLRFICVFVCTLCIIEIIKYIRRKTNEIKRNNTDKKTTISKKIDRIL